MKKYNYGVAAVLVFIGAAMIYLTKDFYYGGLSDIGGGFFPKMLGWILIALSGLMAVDTGIKPETEKTIDFASSEMHRVLRMLAVLFVFCLILKFLGFYIGMLFLVPVCAFSMGERSIPKLAVITICMEVFVYVIFEMILHTGLPGISI